MKKILLIIFTVLFIGLVNAQYTKTQHVSTPGTLFSLSSSYRSTVKNLTVTGNIDARDVKTMRDEMPNLATLNLAEVSIKEYTGTLGTSTTYTIYPANEMPKNSFCFNTSERLGKTTLKSITLPNNITKIGNYAFSNCSGLSGSLIIPNSVIIIGQYAFYMCSGFTGSLTIGNGVSIIEDYAFSNCSGFTGNLTIPNSVTIIGQGAFQSSNFTGKLTLGTGLKTIYRSAFAYCSNLNGNLSINNTVTHIDYQAFESCTGFGGSLILDGGDNIYLGLAIFKNCNRLTSCIITGENLTKIADYMFEECTSLKEITIASSVTNIGARAFYNCKRLNSIHFKSTIPPYSELGYDGKYNSFYNVSRTLCTLYVPIGSRPNYYSPGSGTWWSEFVNIIEETTAVDYTKVEQIKLYPTIVENSFKVFGISGLSHISIMNLNGKIQFEKQIENSENISINNLPKGVYFAKIITNERVVKIKIIKK